MLKQQVEPFANKSKRKLKMFNFRPQFERSSNRCYVDLSQGQQIACCFEKLLLNQAIGYASQHIWCLSQARINWEGCVRKGIRGKNGGDGRDGAPISLDAVAVHPDCWCICLCYLHFAPENPGDEMYLLVLAHPGCPGHSPESHKMVVVCVREVGFNLSLVWSHLSTTILTTAVFLSLAVGASLASSFLVCLGFGDRLRETMLDAMRVASSAMPYRRLVCTTQTHYTLKHRTHCDEIFN